MTRSSLPPLARYITFGPIVALFFLIFATQTCSAAYFGKLIDKLSELHHGVSGEVYAVDGRTLFIKDFTYDGEGPAAFFYVGNSKAPNGNGFRLRDEQGMTNPLKRYRRKSITLTLPEGKILNNVKWFSVWCDEFSVNFGDVKIPRGFDYPRPQKLAALNGVHGVSSEPVVIVDAQTLLIPSFSYDGEAPDAKFWVGAGPTPSPQGIRVPDENGKEQPLRRYDRKTIVLTLPNDLTVHQLGHFGVWCEAFTVDFGHVQIPQSLNVPPSLKMLGISPQSKLNCEVLEDSLAFEVRWAVAGDSIVIQLVGKLDDREYMSFGLSADPERSVMIGGDVVVAWIDKQTLQGYAVDYILDAKSQCSGGRGSCPDTRIREHTNSIRLLNAAMVNGYSIVTYQRPLKASDELDQQIRTNGSQAIIWAIGPLNQRNEVSFHSDYLKTDRFIDFGRPPVWNCPMPDQNQDHAYEDNDKRESSHQELAATTRRPSRVPATPAPSPKNGAWEIPQIQCYEPEDGVFYAQMGPTGGKHGYPAITGHVGWGISWYINGLLIPEINVVRGKKYTFVVEGGVDPETPARYHPFYITDDPIGGYQHKTPEEKSAVKIFAGIRRQRSTVIPTGVGRLCNWVPDQNQPPADEFTSFGAYQRTLTLECDHGEPGIVEWTPDKNTPDTVYYQCFTHRYLGWKINVHDSCDTAEEVASEIRETFAKFESARDPEDLEGDASIRVSSKVTPGPEFFQQHREYDLRHPPPVTNPAIGKLSSHTQLTRSNLPHLIDSYERFQLFEDHAPRSTYSPAAITHEDRKHAYTLFTHNENRYHPDQRGSQIINAPGVQSSSSGAGYEVMESNQEIHQSNQESKLVTDSRPNVSYGTKLSYLRGAPIYSRAPQHAAHQRTQLMVLRKPMQKRRPMVTSVILASPSVSLPPRVPSTLMDRRKQHPDSPTLRFVPNHKQFSLLRHQATKLIKLDARREDVTEMKIPREDVAPSEVAPYALKSTSRTTQGLATNEGFKPESVVVERGFEPIVTNLDLDDTEDKSLEPREENSLPEGLAYRPIDNFEPMFVPSPPDRNRNKKLKKKAQLGLAKARLDQVDDMEMAADRLDSRYLPPTNTVPKKMDELSSDTLVTYDGRTVLDSSLAKTIPRTDERPRGKVSSDLLSRTPQFGKFRGELPPPIPGNVQPENIPQLSSQHSERRVVPEELATALYSQPRQGGNTKLTLVQREKRSSHDHRAMMDDVSTHTNASRTSHNEHVHDHDHHHHDSQNHDHDQVTLGGAGQTIVSNIQYILLTIVLYFVI